MTAGWLPYTGGCRAYPSEIVGHRCVVMESPHLRTHVLTDRGGALLDLVWKPGDIDILWRWERGVRPLHYTPSVDLPQGNYQDHFFGGWDFMFPAVDRAQPPAAPLPTGYHGETFLLPWDWRIETNTHDEVVLVLSTGCVRSPFLVERRFSLARDRSEIVVETRARNTGHTSAKLSLGEHITLKIDDYLAGATLEMDPATTVETSGPPHPNP